MGSEDHRWPVLRREIIAPGLHWELFKFFFIALFQNVLLYLFSGLPVYAALVGNAALNRYDGILTVAFLLLLLGETVADQQQWRFQSVKYAKKMTAPSSSSSSWSLSLAAGSSSSPSLAAAHGRLERDLIGGQNKGDQEEGFLQSGLFQYSRHPNFFCEICMWWVIYAFSITATGLWLNWTIIGAVVLTLLFQGSTSFTESLSLQKYPKYKEYCKTTSRIIPWFPSASSALILSASLTEEISSSLSGQKISARPRTRRASLPSAGSTKQRQTK
jgi:steroid 5-alpha reductase family enzyme